MAKPNQQATDSSGYVPTSIPGVVRLGNKYIKDPNYPPPAPAPEPANLILKPIPKGYAKGGEVKGPGTSTSDSIPAKLSKGEVVIPANVVKHFGLGMFKKMIAAVPPQLGAKTTVKDGVVNAAGGYVNPNEKISKGLQNSTFLQGLVAPIERGSKALASAVQPSPSWDVSAGQMPETNKWEGSANVMPKTPIVPTNGVYPNRSSSIPMQGAIVPPTAQPEAAPVQAFGRGHAVPTAPTAPIAKTGRGASYTPSAMQPVAAEQASPTSWWNKPLPVFNPAQAEPTAQPAPPAIAKPPIAQTPAITTPEVAGQEAAPIGTGTGYAPATISQTGGKTSFTNGQGGLGSVQFKDNRKLSNESQDYLGGVLAREADPGFQQRLKEQAKIVDDRYAWARNREAERQQEAQQANLNAQIQQAQAVLMSPDFGGKRAAAQFLEYAGRLQGQQQQNQQQANQFNQEMAWNREQGANLGATEAAKMAQTERLAQERNNIDTWQPTDTYDPLSGAKTGTRLFNKRTGKYADEEQLAQQKEQAKKADWDSLQLAIKKNPAKAKEYQQRFEAEYGKG
jgi:hypothetical protein